MICLNKGLSIHKTRSQSEGRGFVQCGQGEGALYCFQKLLNKKQRNFLIEIVFTLIQSENFFCENSQIYSLLSLQMI